jgi:valyl-tRNA synthetase
MDNKIAFNSEYDVIYKDYSIKVMYQKNMEDSTLLLEKQISELKSSIERRSKLLSNENYVNKAPKNIVDAEKAKLKEEEEQLKKITNN